MNLPDGNGLTLARELAAGEVPGGRKRPAVVAVTASVLPADREAAIAAGCDGFLDKPYAAADLVAVVAEHLPQR
jgi:CheY-like chemotaxis protein